MDKNNEMNKREIFNDTKSIGNDKKFLKIYSGGYDESLDTGEFGRKAHSSPSKSGGFFNEGEEKLEVSIFFLLIFKAKDFFFPRRYL